MANLVPEFVLAKYKENIGHNDHQSEIVEIFRGFKQGEGFSCCIFIISIDPLIRNINADREIKMVRLLQLGIERKYKFCLYFSTNITLSLSFCSVGCIFGEDGECAAQAKREDEC